MNEERTGMLAPLRERPFRLLFSGQVISNLGDWLDYLALIVIVAYTWQHGPAALAALAIALALPWLVVAPFAGVLADRWPKKVTLIGCDLARAAIVLGFVFAPNLYVLLPLVALKTSFSTLFNPTQQATIRITVPERALMAANSLSQLSVQSTKVIGPALGGLIVAFWSPRVAFALDAATFVVSAAILALLPRLGAVKEEEEEPGERRFWNEFRAGLSYVASRRALVVAIGSIAAAIFLVFMFDTLSPLALKGLGFDASLLGFAIAGIGLGAVVGAIAIGQWGSWANPFALMGAAKIVAGGCVALIGLATMLELDTAPALWIPVVLGIGFASAGILVPYPTILQLETPPALMGRVSATANSVPTVLQLAAPIIGAVIAQWQGIGFLFTVAGGCLVLLGAAVLAIRPPVGVDVPVPAAAAPAPSTAAELDTLEPEVVGFIFRKEGGSV
jgi:MFS family permease